MKELGNIIKSLSEENFYKIIKSFYKQKFNAKEVIIENGPYDGGIDIVVYKDDIQIKKCIQATVQKNGIEDKIFSDLDKAKENIEKYNYLQNVEYFISQNISKSKKNEYETKAETEYDILLRIYDANVLAELSDEYTNIKDTLYGIFNFPNKAEFFKIDQKKKILYDLLAEGKDLGDIKEHFVFSYIISDLYNFPCSTVEKISDRLKDVFSSVTDINFYRTKLNRLKGNGDIIYDNKTKLYSLSDNTKSKIDDILNQSLALEKLLSEEIDNFLQKNSIIDDSSRLIELILEIYKANYEIDIEEIQLKSDNFAKSIQRIYQNIINYFKGRKIDKKKSVELTRELLSICQKSDYLNKISVSLLFTNLYKSQELEKYVNSKINILFIDTQILLRILCAYYRETEIDDYAYTAILDLLKLKRKNPRIRFYTSYDYIDEVCNHIKDAYKLHRFLKLPYLKDFGPSKNVFYNYYYNLKNAKKINIDFIDFLNEITNSNDYNNHRTSGDSDLKQYLIDIFENLDFEFVRHTKYDNYYQIKVEYEKELAHLAKERSNFVIENDLRSILYLSTQSLHTDYNGIINEPYLITWDSTFYSFRKNLLTNHKDYGYWYIYSPFKYIDKYSVSNFKLNSTTINYNIIAIAETNYNMTSKATFLDTISSLFNKEDISDLKLAQKMMDLKKKIKPVIQETEIIGVEEQYSPLTEILVSIINHYSKSESKFNLHNLTSLFEDSNYVDDIIKNIETSLAYYEKNKIIMICSGSFDELLEKKIMTQ